MAKEKNLRDILHDTFPTSEGNSTGYSYTGSDAKNEFYNKINNALDQSVSNNPKKGIIFYEQLPGGSYAIGHISPEN